MTLVRCTSILAALAIVLPIMLASAIRAQSPGPVPAAEPTLAETTQWLDEYLPQLTMSLVTTMTFTDRKKDNTRNFTDSEQVTAAKFTGCSLALEIRAINVVGGSATTTTTSYVVPFDKLASIDLSQQNRNSETIRNHYFTYQPASFFTLTLTAKQPVILTSMRMTDSDGSAINAGPPGYDRGAVVKINADDQALLQRISKAMHHALDLCAAAAKPEPF
jgi:hypothetical protein